LRWGATREREERDGERSREPAASRTESPASCHWTDPYPDLPLWETREGLGSTRFANSRGLVGQNRPASARDYYLFSVWKSRRLSSLNEPLYSGPEAGSRIFPIRAPTWRPSGNFLEFPSCFWSRLSFQ
jgi:hypothetical protein